MKNKLSSLQSRILQGKHEKEAAFDELEEQGSGDEVYDRIKALVGSDNGVVKDVSFKLTPEEQTAMYFSIVDEIRSGEDPEIIARNIMKAIQEKLDELKNEAQNIDGPQGPVFRRSQ